MWLWANRTTQDLLMLVIPFRSQLLQSPIPTDIEAIANNEPPVLLCCLFLKLYTLYFPDQIKDLDGFRHVQNTNTAILLIYPVDTKPSNQSWVCVIFPGVTGMCATWKLSGNEVLEAELCFGPAVTQWTRQGQCTWGLTEQKWVSMKGATGKGGNCVNATPLFLSAHLLIFLHTLLIPLKSFWVMSCCGRAVGTPSCSDGIRESLAWVTAGRRCQGKPSGRGPGVSIKLISREERTSAVSNNFYMILRDSSFQNYLSSDVKLAHFLIYQTHLQYIFVKFYLHIGSNLVNEYLLVRILDLEILVTRVQLSDLFVIFIVPWGQHVCSKA